MIVMLICNVTVGLSQIDLQAVRTLWHVNK